MEREKLSEEDRVVEGQVYFFLVEIRTSQQHNKNNNRTIDQGQHNSDRQSEEEGFSTLFESR